jgi:predicted  nucleic acid-binding Zn ribbon protein
MFAAKIAFAKQGKSQRRMTETAVSLLFTWYRNGQILGDSWPMSDHETHMEAYVMLPEADALDAANNNSHAERILPTCGPTTVTILGRDPYLPDCCTCPSRSAMGLFTHFRTIAPPVVCLDCINPIPLYRLPRLRDDEQLEILNWMEDNRACDTLLMHGNTGERFCEEQLVRYDSSLSRNANFVARSLERILRIPVYYFIHENHARTSDPDLAGRCPSCEAPWQVFDKAKMFSLRCAECRLLSTRHVMM